MGLPDSVAACAGVSAARFWKQPCCQPWRSEDQTKQHFWHSLGHTAYKAQGGSCTGKASCLLQKEARCPKAAACASRAQGPCMLPCFIHCITYSCWFTLVVQLCTVQCMACLAEFTFCQTAQTHVTCSPADLCSALGTRVCPIDTTQMSKVEP